MLLQTESWIKTIQSAIEESINIKKEIMNDQDLLFTVELVCRKIIEAFENGKKIIFCGNGGSAADAQHLAAEFTGKFYLERNPLFAEALHVNTSYMTAVANDYSFDIVYSRLLKAKGQKGDVLIGISTSGNSVNIIKALETAKELGMIAVGLTGEGGGNMAHVCDYTLCVPSKDTARIQEAHITIGHIICQIVERELFA